MSLVNAAAGGGDDSRHVARELALFLLGEAGGEPVRALEAIASAMVNAARRAALRTPGTSWRYALLLEISNNARLRPYTAPHVEDPVFAACMRIARRAVQGALDDVTGGAIRFHPSSQSPAWAAGLVPCASIGGFEFYDEGERQFDSAGMSEAGA